MAVPGRAGRLAGVALAWAFGLALAASARAGTPSVLPSSSAPLGGEVNPLDSLKTAKEFLLKQGANPMIQEQLKIIEQVERGIKKDPAPVDRRAPANGPPWGPSGAPPRGPDGAPPLPDGGEPGMGPPPGPPLDGAPIEIPRFTGRLSRPIKDPRELLLDSSRRIDENPRDFQAVADRAEALNELGEFSAAEAEATRALTLQPRLIRALNSRAFACNKRGQFSLALADSEIVVSQEPGNAMGHMNKAMALEGLGRLKEALFEFETAANLDPAFMVFYREAVRRHGGAGPSGQDKPAQPVSPSPGGSVPVREAAAILAIIASGFVLWKVMAARSPGPAAPSPAQAGTAPGQAGPDSTETLPGAAGQPQAAAGQPQAAAGPSTIGSYRLDRELAQGGMGIIYEGTDTALQRKVAIKKLRREMHQDRAFAEAFLAEARLVASLKHPNLVEIYAVLEDKGELYLVFEFVNGRPLDKLLASKRRFETAEAIHLLEQVAAGLDYAHSRNVIHRDLKPANVLISLEGTAKLTDFGIAHRARQSASRMTQAAPWGTPHYMPPEQETGSVKLESDIFALGVMTYEMLTGSIPFPGPDFSEQKRSLCYAPASTKVFGIHPLIDAAIKRALSVKPEDRFHSGAEFIKALRDAGSAPSYGGLAIPPA